MTDLAEQIANEKAEIENAPKVPVATLQPRHSGNAGRCSLCGRMAKHLELIDTMHGVERFKGECCGAAAGT